MLFSVILFLVIDLKAELKANLYQEVSSAHKPITYKNATIYLFTLLDNTNGVVCSVYSPSECIISDTVPSAKVMNVEHTWPQSEGANGVSKSDLHHLYATTSATNSMRSSLPFCNVSLVKWQGDQSRRGLSSFGDHCFEPPAKHKGNVARALFYFSVRYNLSIDAHQEFFLRQWHKEDSVDEEEVSRNKKIYTLQNNLNPFVSRPDLVEALEDF